MCLAVPMKVVKMKGEGFDLFNPPVATVEAKGTFQKVRLDIVDRLPEVGDYLLVHAGFAIKCLKKNEAMESLKLLKEMAENAKADM